jgi:hypothetical protein
MRISIALRRHAAAPCVALATRRLALVNPEGAVKARKRAPAASRRQSAGSIARRASLPIMRPGMVNGL